MKCKIVCSLGFVISFWVSCLYLCIYYYWAKLYRQANFTIIIVNLKRYLYLWEQSLCNIKVKTFSVICTVKRKQVSLYNESLPLLSTLNAVLQWNRYESEKLKKYKNNRNHNKIKRSRDIMYNMQIQYQYRYLQYMTNIQYQSININIKNQEV